MSFKAPIWNNKNNCYEININIDTKFEYIELRTNNNLEKEPESSEFHSIVNTIIEELGEQGKTWFSSPIKSSVVLKRLVHKYNRSIPAVYEDNTRYKLMYTPKLFIIYPGKFELYWNVNYVKDDLIPSEFIEFSEELEDSPAKTIIINDIVENVEIPFDNNEEIVEEVSSRAAFKQKVRHARLKAAIASMKAEKMAEKYFRRYGIQTGLEFESDSELSLESDESESE